MRIPVEGEQRNVFRAVQAGLDFDRQFLTASAQLGMKLTARAWRREHHRHCSCILYHGALRDRELSHKWCQTVSSLRVKSATEPYCVQQCFYVDYMFVNRLIYLTMQACCLNHREEKAKAGIRYPRKGNASQQTQYDLVMVFVPLKVYSKQLYRISMKETSSPVSLTQDTTGKALCDPSSICASECMETSSKGPCASFMGTQAGIADADTARLFGTLSLIVP